MWKGVYVCLYERRQGGPVCAHVSVCTPVCKADLCVFMCMCVREGGSVYVHVCLRVQ